MNNVVIQSRHPFRAGNNIRKQVRVESTEYERHLRLVIETVDPDGAVVNRSSARLDETERHLLSEAIKLHNCED